MHWLHIYKYIYARVWWQNYLMLKCLLLNENNKWHVCSRYIQLSTLFCVYTNYGKVKPELLVQKYSNTWQQIIPSKINWKIFKKNPFESTFLFKLSNQIKKPDNVKTTHGFKSRLNQQQNPRHRGFWESFLIL